MNRLLQAMNRLLQEMKPVLPALALVCAIFSTSACATASAKSEQAREYPPVLAHNELLRPYHKVATVEVRRARWGHPADLAPDDYDWAYDAMRREADKIGADAVITPEVRIEMEWYLFFPMSEMKARGIAIKFR